MPQNKKRKFSRKVVANNSEEGLKQRFQQVLDNIVEDEGKMEAFVRFCEKATGTENPNLPSWAKESAPFFSTLNITPMNWNPMFSFPKESLERINDLYQTQDSWEKFESLKRELKSSFEGCRADIRTVMELLCSTRKLFDIFKRKDLGELVVTSAINGLFDALCLNFNNVSLNGDKQHSVCLSDDLPLINARNDGFLQTEEIRFLLREDKAIDHTVKWNDPGTDGQKLIICMKSLLRENMQYFRFNKEQMEKYSKVMGLSYLQKSAFLFILEAQFEEQVLNNCEQLIVVPKYYLYMKEVDLRVGLELWLDMAFFIQNYVPENTVSTTNPYRPISETPLKNKVELKQLLTSKSKETKSVIKKMKRNKPVVKFVENHEETCFVRTVSVMKTVGAEEHNIITNLFNRNEYCLYLPQILNIYSNEVEFETLRAIPEQFGCEDIHLLELACDISVALNYLHSNNIVHRDVKPHNIMMRNIHYSNISSWFVLIDFGLSFEMEKNEGCCFRLTDNGKELVTEDVGTGYFKAPEVGAKVAYDEKIDIYSLGASLLYLKNKTLYSTIFNNATINDEQVNLQISMKGIEWEIVELGKMVLKMVDIEPKNRPSANDLETFFSSLHANKIDIRHSE